MEEAEGMKKIDGFSNIYHDEASFQSTLEALARLHDEAEIEEPLVISLGLPDHSMALIYEKNQWNWMDPNDFSEEWHGWLAPAQMRRPFRLVPLAWPQAMCSIPRGRQCRRPPFRVLGSLGRAAWSLVHICPSPCLKGENYRVEQGTWRGRVSGQDQCLQDLIDIRVFPRLGPRDGVSAPFGR